MHDRGKRSFMKKLDVMVIAAIFLLGCNLSKQSSPSPPTSGSNSNMRQRTSDLDISENAQRHLQDRGLEDVNLEVTDGEVTLKGQVETEEQKEMAEVTVRNTPGVVSVNNEITVQRKPPVNGNKPGGPRKTSRPNKLQPDGAM
jgi:BON domain-containing protein